MKKFLQEIEDLIIETTVEEYPNLEDFPEDMRDSIEVNTISKNILIFFGLFLR